MLLPLGFGGRFPRIPWVTAALCFGILALHQRYGSMSVAGGENSLLGWAHMFGNLVVLFLVGSLVESRRSPWMMFVTFLLGSGAGFLIQGMSPDSSPFGFLVAGSSGIAAVAGLFTSYFYRFRMKFVIFAVPPFYKTFHVSSLVVLPLTFYATYVVAVVAQGHEGQITNLAHLGASVIGIVAGFAYEKLAPIPWPLLYSSESHELKLIANDPNPHQRIHRALDMLKVNPENLLAAEIVSLETIKLIKGGFPVTPEFRDLLTQHVPAVMSVYKRHNHLDKAYLLLPEIPTQIGFSALLSRSSQEVLFGAMKWAKERDDHWTYLRLCEVWTKRFVSQKRKTSLEDEIKDLVAKLEKTPENYRCLSLLYHADTRGPLAKTYQESLNLMSKEAA